MSPLPGRAKTTGSRSENGAHASAQKPRTIETPTFPRLGYQLKAGRPVKSRAFRIDYVTEIFAQEDVTKSHQSVQR